MSLAKGPLPRPCQLAAQVIGPRGGLVSTCIAEATYCATPQAEESPVQFGWVQWLDHFLAIDLSLLDSHVTVSAALSAPPEDALQCPGREQKAGRDPMGRGRRKAGGFGPQAPQSCNPTGQIAVEQGSGLVTRCLLDRGPIAWRFIMCCASPPSWQKVTSRRFHPISTCPVYPCSTTLSPAQRSCGSATSSVWLYTDCTSIH
jgi:hypothetical protein